MTTHGLIHPRSLGGLRSAAWPLGSNAEEDACEQERWANDVGLIPLLAWEDSNAMLELAAHLAERAGLGRQEHVGDFYFALYQGMCIERERWPS